MRSGLAHFCFIPMLLGLLAGGTAFPAMAGSDLHDRVYADSFGNLVIQSRAGYKRIVVGAGHLARQLSGYELTGDEASANAAPVAEQDKVVSERPCHRPPVLVKGRSYMYGFDEGEIPLQGGACR